MNEQILMWVLGGQSIVIFGLAGWLFIHERSCSSRWATHMQKFGELKGRVEQWHEDQYHMRERIER